MKVSICSLGEESTARYLDQCRLAEILGFHGFYHADEKWTRDGYVRLAAAASVTSRLALGVVVADPYSRHPAFLAQMTATLAEMAPAGFKLVLGSGSRFEMLPDVRPDRPVTAIREAVALLRSLWAGERVTMDGSVVRFHDGQLTFKPTAIPSVGIASRGPQILALGGEIADEVVIGSFATPSGIAWAQEQIARGSERAQRPMADVRLSSWLTTSILDGDDEAIPDSLRRGLSHAFRGSRKMIMARIDELAPDASTEFRELVNSAPDDWPDPVLSEVRRLMPSGLFDAMALVGTPDRVTTKLQALELAGVDEAILWLFPRDDEDVEDVIVRVGHSILPTVSRRPPREPYAVSD